MFELQLAWDRPARTGQDPTLHVLRARLVPQEGRQSLPLRIALVLDTSTSMEGDKLEQAKLACMSIAGMLRPQDILWFAGYATQVVPLCNGLEGDLARSICQDALARLTAAGVTRTDLALDWIRGSLPDESGTALVGIVVTDGHATDPKGEVLRDTSFIIDQARSLATSNITLCSVGLGDALHFNTQFLVDLANNGRGEFIYAGTLDDLEPRLRDRFAASQSVSASDARLQLEIVRAGARIRNCCRLRPEYIPLDAPTSTGDALISIGALRSDAPTDILIEVEVPQLPFGESAGAHNVLEVSLIASGLDAPLFGAAAISDTKSYTEAQALNTEVDRDRILRDVAAYSEELSRTDDPNKTGDLLNKIADGAQKGGQLHLAEDARKKLEELKRNGKLKPDSSTSLLDRAKKAGGAR